MCLPALTMPLCVQIVNLSESFLSTWVSCCTLKVLAWRWLGVCRGGAAWMFFVGLSFKSHWRLPIPKQNSRWSLYFYHSCFIFFSMHLTAQEEETGGVCGPVRYGFASWTARICYNTGFLQCKSQKLAPVRERIAPTPVREYIRFFFLVGVGCHSCS